MRRPQAAALLAVLSAAPAAAQFRVGPVPDLRPTLTAPALPVLPSAVLLPGAAPALTAPTGLSASVLPALAAPRPIIALPVAQVPVLAAPMRAVAAPADPAALAKASPLGSDLARFAARFGEAAKGGSAAAASYDAAGLFDGSGRRAAADAAPARLLPKGFARRTFESRDGAAIGYGVRRAAAETGPARVFVGGMTLPDSFLTYFRSGPSGRTDYALTLRGLPPTGWLPTREILDADARDLARMIVLAAARSPGGRVELALHSYGALVFQRMVQLRGDDEAASALEALRGGRVALFAPTTHYGDSETVAGPQYAQMARQVRMFMEWLDAGDAVVALWRAAARLNPLLWGQTEALAAAWAVQRDAALALAAKPASSLLLQHLADPWAPELEPARRLLVDAAQRAARDPGWQEAAMRRANDTSRLDFTPADVQAVRDAGIRLDLVLSRRDQLIPWASARLLPSMFGIELPDAPPAAGTVLSDASGRVRALVEEGDHYLPLKEPGAARRVLGG